MVRESFVKNDLEKKCASETYTVNEWPRVSAVDGEAVSTFDCWFATVTNNLEWLHSKVSKVRRNYSI